MIALRTLHRYLGVFFMPIILFFAFSGALQTFGLHESERRGEPPPTPWIATIASVHKDQHLPVKRTAAPRPAPAPDATGTAPAAAAPASPPRQEKSPLPLKLFVFVMAIGLCVTSLIGMYLALSVPSTRKASVVTLILGAIMPLLLLFL